MNVYFGGGGATWMEGVVCSHVPARLCSRQFSAVLFSSRGCWRLRQGASCILHCFVSHAHFPGFLASPPVFFMVSVHKSSHFKVLIHVNSSRVWLKQFAGMIWSYGMTFALNPVPSPGQ